jgi:hypothetical protein
MKRKLKRGDSVCVSFGGEVNYCTVTRVGRYEVRVLFPIRKFEWVPIGACEKKKR